MPKIFFNGKPGEVWTNDSGRIAYQFHASLVNTCGACLQYHMAVKYGPWPVPIHRGCRCVGLPVAPGAEAQPFVDFQAILSDLPRSQQVAAVGAANYRLIASGLASFADVVTSTRVRPFFEVVARGKFSVQQMTGVGVPRGVAERAYATVHTPAIELARQHANRLIEQITKTGLSREQVIERVGQHFADKVGVAPIASKSTAAKLAESDVPKLVQALKAIQKTMAERTAAKVGQSKIEQGQIRIASPDSTARKIEEEGED